MLARVLLGILCPAICDKAEIRVCVFICPSRIVLFTDEATGITEVVKEMLREVKQ